MSYISFDKQQLINLEFSLSRELIRTNRAGSYSSTTIIGCNTRKYHGLLVALQPQIDDHHHVLLSSMDVTVIQQNAEFNLGIHQYGDKLFDPGGHKYAREFDSDPIPKMIYRVGGVRLSCETLFPEDENRVLLKYKLLDAHSPTKLRFRPLLAYRSVHFLSKANDGNNIAYDEIHNGIRVKMYDNYDPLFMQFSKKPDYFHKPDWYYGIEYAKEKSRGYEFKEDLFSPGFFELEIKKGESVIFSAATKEGGKEQLAPVFEKEIKSRIPRNNFRNCLRNDALQFLMERGDKAEVIAGYHWFNVHGRDTFIALPGLTLLEKQFKLFIKVMDTMVGAMDNAFFPNDRHGKIYKYNSVDAPLWFFWALQQYVRFTGDYSLVWKKYGKIMQSILEKFKTGTDYNIHMEENGLLWSGNEYDALTWMNSIIEGIPVIKRYGLAVEVNALWYNAIQFFIEVVTKTKAKTPADEWNIIIAKIDHSFTQTFWDEKAGYLADVVRGSFRDMAVRPNQMFVASLPYSPVSDEIKHKVLQIVEQELLTPKGIRTLSPKNPDYIGIYKGNIAERDRAYHLGSAFPWLLGHFAEGYLKLYRKSGIAFIRRLYENFESVMTEVGITTISELYNGNPPHIGKGAISQAWSVAELMRIDYLLKLYNKNTDQTT